MFQGMEYVYEVYKEKSFSKAAANLFISQPSLSANVKRVEKRIGFPIFDRSTKAPWINGMRKRIHPLRGRNSAQSRKAFSASLYYDFDNLGHRKSYTLAEAISSPPGFCPL